jgi:tetratricopeptide (TPR) repeat protein
MNNRLVRLSVVVAALGLLVEGRGLAAGRQVQERAARKACLTGDWATGVSLLSDLFLDTRDPTYLFNQGRCLEQNRRYDEAIARFNEYLSAAESSRLTAADRAAAEKHIRSCRESLAQQTSQPPEATTPSPQAAATAQPSPAVQPPPEGQAVAAIPSPGQAEPASPGSGLRAAGIATASVGVAALIAGLIFNLKNNSMSSDMEDTPGGYSSSKDSDRRTYETLGWLSYGLGAACVATGVVLFAVGLRSNAPDGGGVALVPTFAPGQAGAALRGGF